eukprot:gene416-7857_t
MKLTLAVTVAFVVVLASFVGGQLVRPTVLWHGMTYTSTLKGRHLLQSLFDGVDQKRNRKKLTRRLRLQIEDEFQGFFGNVNDQVDYICRKLKNDPDLRAGFNAVGFSQGGQMIDKAEQFLPIVLSVYCRSFEAKFLRAYVQRCNDPPVYNLVSMGGQHMGVSDFPYCTATNTTLCELMAEALTIGAYVDGIRNYSVQAQYFRSSYDYGKYLEKNIFLADLNNEHATKNRTYKKNLVSLNKFVMVEFTKDTMVVPRDSEVFGAFANGTMDHVIPMRQQPIYTEDWIGLKELDASNRLIELNCPGNHLEFSMEYFRSEIITPFLNNTVTV